MAIDPSPMAGVDDRWRRRTFASLRQPAFRRYYGGLLFSFVGFWMRIAATGWYVYEQSGSHERLGVITAASLLPWVPFGPLGGVVADRVDQRLLLARAYVGVILLNVALGIGILVDRVGWTELLVATALTGCLQGVIAPTRHAIVRRLVDVEALGNAVGLSAAGFHGTGAVGFALAGAVYAVAGPGVCFLCVGAASLVMVVQVLRTPFGPQVARPEIRHPARDLQVGFAYVWSHTLTRTVIFGVAGVVFLLLTFRVLMPAIVRDDLGLGPLGYGLIMSVMGVGAFSAALWVASGSGGRDRRARNMFKLVWTACAGVLAVAWVHELWLFAPAALVVGFCQVGFMASANTTVQERVPDHLRARVMGIWALVFGAAYPLGSAAMGWVADRVTPAWAITGGAAITAVLAALLFARSGSRLAIAVGHEVGQGDEQLG